MTDHSDGLRQEIVEAASNNRLTIICGAGVSLHATAGDARAGWVGLLTHGLTWCESRNIELPGDDGLARAHRDLDAGDLLSVAEKLQRGLRDNGQWELFVTETFSAMQLVDRELIEAVVALNAPIATTNYDTLIELIAGQPAVSWRSPAVLQKSLLDRSAGIAHLHGVWTDPDTVILGTANYGALLATGHAQTLERALFLRSSVLFIGCGAGLDDPNFSMLRRYLLESFAGSPITHYQLVTETQAADDSSTLSHRESIKKVIYGRSHKSLPTYIWELAREVRTKSYGQRALMETGNLVKPKTQSALLSMPLLRGTGPVGPTLAQLWPDLLLDTRVRPLRSLRPMVTYIRPWLDSTTHSHVVIIGGAGAGKSTLLRRIAIDGPTLSLGMPLFLSAQECLKIAPESIPHGSTVMIDGLDEVADEGLTYIAHFLKSLEDRQWWVSCRSDFFARATPVRSTLSNADEVLELQPLLLDQVSEFISNYVAATKDEHAARVFEAWRKAEDFNGLIVNPLNLIISIITASRLSETDGITAPTTRFDLYRMFYEHLVEYEADRNQLSAREARTLRTTHVRIAQQIYLRRQRSQSPPSASSDLVGSRQWPAISSLLDLYNLNNETLIRGFAHETFGEFTLAYDLVQKFLATSSGLVAPNIAFNDDVNAFVREAIAGFTHLERRQALERLTQAYRKASSTRAREHLLYYIGRLEVEACPPVLREAYVNEVSPVARRAAALGAILYGDIEIERDYVSRLESSDEEEELNRSVQLVYFGDVMGDLHKSKDRGGDWTRTRRALLQRLSESGVRARRLKWWDLYTLRSFLRSRNATLTTEEREVVGRIASTFVDTDRQRQISIRSLASSLL